ncbi:MAG: transposase [Nostochopsis sp.]
MEPLTGQHFQQEYPKLNGDYFQEFLDWLSQQLGGDYAILQIDQAPAHISSAINWPENIIPLLQPPHSPELNPIERLWQFLKKSLHNELFSSLQDLRDRVQQLFEQLTFDEVISISSYNFILEALFYAASYEIGISFESNLIIKDNDYLKMKKFPKKMTSQASLFVATCGSLVMTLPANAIPERESYQNIDSSDIFISISTSENISPNINQPITSEINSKNENNIYPHTNSQENDISYSAVDLEPQKPLVLGEETTEEQLLAKEIDLDTLCNSFPLNYRCVNYQPPSKPQKQQQLVNKLKKRQSSGFALTGKVGTLGIGIEGTAAISPNFNGRLGFNYFNFGVDVDKNNIKYDADVELLSMSGLLDWFPSSRSQFHITGGLIYNKSRVDAVARSGTLDIGGVDFSLASVGQIKGEAKFPNTIAPYIGIGYGNPVKRGQRFNFSIDLGVMFPGSPEVNLNATDLAAGLLKQPMVEQLLDEAIAKEEKDIEDDLSWLNIYPILSIGFSYQF